MTLLTLMQAGPAKTLELFTRVADTSDTALKTRERLFAELKGSLEQHVDLEEKHLFPILRRQPDTKDLVVAAIRDNKELRARLGELDTLPKNDETFIGKLDELKKAFRQHARDEKRELLPVVQKVLSDEQAAAVAERMAATLAEAEQARLDQAEEKRTAARQEREEREQAELVAQQERQAERKRQDAARQVDDAARKSVKAAVQATEVVAEGSRQVARAVTEGTQRVTARTFEAAGEAVSRTAAVASAMPNPGSMFWDMMLGMTGTQSNRAAAVREAGAPAARQMLHNEEVIPLAEEVLVVGKRTVNTGTTRIRRYVVETAVEQQVTLVRERVVVERRRPGTAKVNGETLTEMTFEVVETDEVPVIAKTVQLREEIVVRTERTEHVETVRETVRQDEVEIEHADTRKPARARA